MPLTLYLHPFAAYCWKPLIALYENATPFEDRIIDQDHPDNAARWAALWPLKKFPVLVDGDLVLPEATIIIEHLDLAHPGPTPLIPKDPHAAIQARLMDRVFDNHVMEPMQKIVGDAIRPPPDRDPHGVTDARARLDTVYAWLETRLQPHAWATGQAFTLADCAAAPALFYADWAHPIGEAHPTLRAYRTRLLARPSVARVVDEARPYRGFFPLGDPGRD